MNDADGAKTISNQISFDIPKHEKKVKIKISPNPVHTTGSITISGELKGKVTLSIYNINGKIALELFSGEVNSSLLTYSLNAGNFQKGIYILELKTSGGIMQKKLLFQ